MENTWGWLGRLRAWWATRKPKQVDELIAVEFDEREVRVLALAPVQSKLDRRFLWSDITRVCFKDEGLYSSDIITIELGASRPPAVVPTESHGGDAFFGALTERGYFPEQVWRRAMGETGGATHCWPPREA